MRSLILRVAAQEVEAAIALCTSDVVYVIDDVDVWEGHDGLRANLAEQASIFDWITVEFGSIVSADDKVMVERTERCSLHGSPLDLEIGSVFSVREGQVCSWTDYMDLRELYAHFGH